jgi:Fic family protein
MASELDYLETLVIMAESLEKKITMLQNDLNDVKTGLYNAGILARPVQQQENPTTKNIQNLWDKRDSEVPEDLFKKLNKN